MKRLLAWLKQAVSPPVTDADAELPQSGVRVRPLEARPQPPSMPSQPSAGSESGTIETSAESAGQIVDGGPGKNILIRNQYAEQDSGTQKILEILDSPDADAAQEDGIDPYNSGVFDPSTIWNKSFRK